jgi:small basic protein
MTEDEVMEILKKQKKSNFSKKIVISVILLNIIFTVAVMYLFLQTGNEPMTLVGAWFGFTTIELWSLASIKRTKEGNNG